MKRPRLRFTVRRLMIAVAIVAVSISAMTWVIEMRIRSAIYNRRAFDFAIRTAHSGSNVIMPNGRMVNRYENEDTRINDAWDRKMAEKYWRLSNYPWLTAEPDPPRPERLAHPRSAIDLPEKDDPIPWEPGSDPPAWTFLWTWRR